jgi:hypothetical protein
VEVLAGAPLLSPVMTGRAKKEGAMQQTHCNGGGRDDRDSREMEVAAMGISCCLSKIVRNPGSHKSVYEGNNYLTLGLHTNA